LFRVEESGDAICALTRQGQREQIESTLDGGRRLGKPVFGFRFSVFGYQPSENRKLKTENLRSGFSLRRIGGLGQGRHQIEDGAQLGQAHAEAIEKFLQGEFVVQSVFFLVIEFVA
jgi:hypothetical protein